MIEIRDLSFSIVKSFKVPVETREIFYGGTACVLLAGPTSIALFDLQQQKVLNELTTQPIKYVIWNSDNSQVALLGKHSKLFSLMFLQSKVNLTRTRSFPSP